MKTNNNQVAFKLLIATFLGFLFTLSLSHIVLAASTGIKPTVFVCVVGLEKCPHGSIYWS